MEGTLKGNPDANLDPDSLNPLQLRESTSGGALGQNQHEVMFHTALGGRELRRVLMTSRLSGLQEP